MPADHPLLTLENVVVLPHIGIASKAPPTPVNPEAWPQLAGGAR